MWTNPRYRELTGQDPPGRATVGPPTGPPTPTGTPLASFPRKGPDGVEQELRVVLDEFEGHPYLALRVWQRDAAGAWWPTKKGVSVRLTEAAGVAGALQRALDLAGKQAAPDQRTERPTRETPPRRHPRPDGRPGQPAVNLGDEDAY
jgi:hypothetical protein